VKPAFRIDKRQGHWTVDVFYIVDEEHQQQPLFGDWGGFEEPFSESTYDEMSKWCQMTFKAWENPKRARRMSFNQFWFKSKKDLDWFILHWSGVDLDSV
jgi:hypothetical protein